MFGEHDGYIMIQYGISAKRLRIGWIEASALPKGVDVPLLTFAGEQRVIVKDCALTDDPFMSRTAIVELAAGTQVIFLGDFGEFLYVEADVDGRSVWGFVPADAAGKE